MTSTIANTVSTQFNRRHPELSGADPAVLMAGFRAAGWTCCGTVVIALVIAVVGMRGIGLVGQQRLPRAEKPSAAAATAAMVVAAGAGDIEMQPRSGGTPALSEADRVSVLTLAAEPEEAEKPGKDAEVASQV